MVPGLNAVAGEGRAGGVLRRRLLLAAGIGGPVAVGAGPKPIPLRIRFPRPMRDIDLARWYPLQVLRLALQRAGLPHRLEPSSELMGQGRALLELADGREPVDLVWSVTSREREARLLPIRVPIFRGLYGWRLLLTRLGEAARFAGVHSLADLRAFSLLQGVDWPDTGILRANGLRVETASHFDSLFRMLALGRADLFPRGVTEIGWEQREQAQAFEVEPRLALHYPAAEYFFVHPRNQRLAEALQSGLQQLVERGELQQLLQQHFGKDLLAAGLGQRRLLRLSNPGLPEATPLQDARLWWRPT